LSWIRRQQPSSFKASDALDRLSRSQFPDMSTVNAALLQLEQLGWIRKRPDPPRQGSGRSASPTYNINPREVRPPEGDGGAAC